MLELSAKAIGLPVYCGISSRAGPRHGGFHGGYAWPWCVAFVCLRGPLYRKEEANPAGIMLRSWFFYQDVCSEQLQDLGWLSRCVNSSSSLVNLLSSGWLPVQT